MSKIKNFIIKAQQVLHAEAEAILNIIPNLDENFNIACELILNCQGKIILTGMGKSGHIARKIAATMASTGTPAFFIHPGEASHGDLGMVTNKDIVLMISNSGETDELLTIIPLLKRANIPIISITSNINSRIAKYSNSHIFILIQQEACPLNLAPTTSTTCALAVGDALAISLLTARKFNQQDFAKYHPNGRLGKRLFLKISDIMHTQDSIPIVNENTSLFDGIIEMSKKCFGLLLVAEHKSNNKKILGVLSDGDLRRILDKKLNIYETKLLDVINRKFKSITPESLAVEAINIMEDHKIFSLPVIKDNNIMGIFNMHDLLKAGVL